MLTNFEALEKNPKEHLISVINFLQKQTIQYELDKLYEHSLAKSTITKSDKFINLTWTDKEEKLFREIGGIEANEILGYDPDGKLRADLISKI